MKNLIFTICIVFLSFAFGSLYNEANQRMNFEHVENVDEMESTPAEVYIYVNGHKYKVNTETNETTLIY